MSVMPLSRDVGSTPNAPSTPPGPLDVLLDLVVERLVSPIAAELAALPRAEPEAEAWHLLTVQEVAARLGRSARWVRERAKRGDLPFVRLDGGALAFEIDDVRAFAQARRVPATAPPPLAARLHEESKPASPAGSKRAQRATDPGVG
jgi:excisionase family DNA binding protein